MTANPPTMTDAIALTVPPGAGHTQAVLELWRKAMLRRSSITVSFAPNAERSLQKPKRRRKQSLTRTIKRARKAGERGPVRVEHVNADSSRTIVTSSRDDRHDDSG